MRSGAKCLGAAGPGDEGPGARGEEATAESPKKKKCLEAEGHVEGDQKIKSHCHIGRQG